MIDSIIREDIEGIKHNLKDANFERKSVLITGGAGFIGSWLCDLLLSLDAEVTCVDDLSTGIARNIDHLVGNPRFEFLNADACTFSTRTDFNCILHMASPASPEDYQRRPLETLRANSLGSLNMAELARRKDATVLFASTSEIYGDAQVVPTPETYWGNVNPIGPRSCYDEGKRFAEALFAAYHEECGLDVRIARIFNSFGPRLREDGFYARAVSRFITQALAKKPITIYGDGLQTRSFCYVTDTISGLMLLILHKKASGEVVNVGNPHEITVLQLANKIKGLTRSKSPIAFRPRPKDDPNRRCPDTSKIENLFGWKAKVNLEEGLRRTISWFEGKPNNESGT